MIDRKDVDAAMAFEGMTTAAGLGLMDFFIDEAVCRNDTGALIEFGTYKGRTSALLAQFASAARPLEAVEQSDYLEIDRLREITPHVTWHRAKSETFCRDQLGSVLAGRRIVATHHDASHFFDNVAVELGAVVLAMQPGGVVILDDFSDAFSQVRAAYYFLRYTQSLPFELLLIGFNKAMLVHQDAFASYEALVLESLQPQLSAAGIHCMLHRSDIHRHSRTFFVRQKSALTEEDRYGTRFWGDRFYQSSERYLKR